MNTGLPVFLRAAPFCNGGEAEIGADPSHLLDIAGNLSSQGWSKHMNCSPRSQSAA
jgi:hypothetical protein